jgi:hypothetical protein
MFMPSRLALGKGHSAARTIWRLAVRTDKGFLRREFLDRKTVRLRAELSMSVSAHPSTESVA